MEKFQTREEMNSTNSKGDTDVGKEIGGEAALGQDNSMSRCCNSRY
jgi:hypothetical protein